MIDSELLRELPLTRSLADAAVRVVAARASVRRYSRGQVLWTAGTEVDYLAVVIDGRIRVVREGRGRQLVVHTEGPGGTLGEVAFFTGGSTPATAIAAEPTRCLILSRPTIVAVMREDPELAWLLLKRMAERVGLLVNRLDRLALETARTRLASLLVAASEQARSSTVDLAMTQSALAEELGTVREVVVRALRDFRHAHIIAPVGRGRIQLLNIAELRKIVADGS